jgi:AraC-like DNA-binding protein
MTYARPIVRKDFPDIHLTIELLGAHLQHIETDWFYGSHRHNFYEINMVLSGQRKLQIGGTIYRQRPREVILIRPNIFHSTEVSHAIPVSHFTLHFSIDDPELVALMASTSQVSFAEETLAGLLTEMSGLVEGQSKDTALSDRLRFQSLAITLLAELSTVLRKEWKSEEALIPRYKDLAEKLKERLTQEVNALNFEHHPQRMRRSLNELCADLGYSRAYCNRVFRSLYGISLREYLSHLLLHQAEVLLGQSQMSLSDIANRLGYGSPANFSRQFRRWAGCNPREFRRVFRTHSTSTSTSDTASRIGVNRTKNDVSR